MRIFEREGIPAGKICTIADLFENPQVIAREMIVNLSVGERKIGMAGNPLKFSETPVNIGVPAPKLGEHTEEILRGLLGMESDEIEKLRREGII